jgi:hypothetical protein
MEELMSTRSTISAKIGDNVYSIYCHFDGYPSHHWPILTQHYNTQEAVEKLISLGDLSSLDISPDCPEGHCFDNKIKGYCVAYGRDRGEEETQAKKHLGRSGIEKQEYNYYWNGEAWEWKADGEKEWHIV